MRAGDTVLDLGSGGGKICYLSAQIVGNGGRVIGVDMNDDMLALARKYQPEMAQRLGSDRVRFVKGYIQDLALDLETTENYLRARAPQTAPDLEGLKAFQDEQRRTRPLIPDASVDLVVSNCVLNLVNEADRHQMVREIYRVLRPGGRVAISDIVSDEPVPPTLKADANLWSGCVAGAFSGAGLSQGLYRCRFSGGELRQVGCPTLANDPGYRISRGNTYGGAGRKRALPRLWPRRHLPRAVCVRNR